MVCPVRKEIKFGFEKVESYFVQRSYTETFPECYGEECPYYDEYSIPECQVVKKELENE